MSGDGVNDAPALKVQCYNTLQTLLLLLALLVRLHI
jgi:hypothetical protein